VPSVDGIVSGLNTSAIIKAMVDAESIPKKVLESKTAYDKSRLDKIAGIKSRLQTVSEKLAAMSTSAKFAAKTLTNSDEAQFTATVTDSDALAAGTLDVQVTSLAKNQIFRSGSYSSSSDVVSQGVYTVNVGGTSHNVTITASNDDITGLAKAIDDVTGVSARVVDRGSAYDLTNDRYQILVTGDEPGAANTVIITNPAGGASNPDWSTIIQTPTNATLSIGGGVSPITISATSNTVTNAIEGVTLTLKDVGAAASKVTVAVDTAQIEENVNDFIDAYNAVINYYNANNTYDSTTGDRGALFGEGSVRQVISSLGNLLSGSYVTGGAFKAFSMIGVQTNKDGTIELNTDSTKGQTLSGALTNNFTDVQKLFTAGWTTEGDTSDDGPGRALAAAIDDLFVDSTSGTLTTASTSLEGKIADQEERVDVLSARLTDYEERLRKQYTALETALSRIKSSMSYITAAFGLQGSSNG